MKRLSVLRAAALLSILLFFSAMLPMSTAQVNATTWQYNNWRTGQNTSETTLTTTSVTENRFGKVCSASVDGQIYAQPLVLWNSSTSKNVVYVVTQNDSIYAFDGTNCALIASNTTLIPSNEAPAECDKIGGGLCNTIAPSVGILGTPVIDIATNTLYLITESQFPRTGPTTWYHRIHALDAATLQPKTSYNSPQIIAGSVSTGLTFVSLTHIQRPGLLWTPGPTPASPTLYAAFSMMDGALDRPSGWIFAYDGYNLSATGYPLVYATAPQQSPVRAVGDGIWQGGAGLAAGLDENGGYYLYFSTGDGTFDLSNGGQDAGDSFVKLTTTLNETPAGYFSPSDSIWRSCLSNDRDFGSGGTMLIPDGTISAYPNLAVKADKEGALWVMKRGSPGGFSPGSCDQTACPNTQACSPANQNNQNVQTVWTSDQHVFSEHARVLEQQAVYSGGSRSHRDVSAISSVQWQRPAYSLPWSVRLDQHNIHLRRYSLNFVKWCTERNRLGHIAHRSGTGLDTGDSLRVRRLKLDGVIRQ